MPLSFSIPDTEIDMRTMVTFMRDPGGVAHVSVNARVNAGDRILPIGDDDTLDACVADGTITVAERTVLAATIRKLVIRARARMGVAP
jgi:hypothetical protein